MHSLPEQTPTRTIWWLNPGKLLLCFYLPLYAFVASLVPTFWPQFIVLRYGTYLSTPYVILGGAALLFTGAFALLGWFVTLGPATESRPLEINPMFLYVTGGLTAFAYVVWFAPLLGRGELFVEREELNRIPGVTSLSQAGVPFVVGYLHNRLRARSPIPRALRLLFTLVLLLTLLRVFAWKERLAMVEVGIPVAVLVLTYSQPRHRWQRAGLKAVSALGPLLAIPALLGFFSLTEFFRSWSSPSYQAKNLDLVDFMISRLTTYYYTALNNGAGLLATNDWPVAGMVHVLNWFYRLPFGVGEKMWELFGPNDSPDSNFLMRFADPEFNNMSGIFPIFYDLGPTLALVYFALFGFLAGLCYRALHHGNRLGFVFYPLMYVACLEVMRISYLHGPRAFVILVVSAIALTQFRPVVRQKRTSVIDRLRPHASSARPPASRRTTLRATAPTAANEGQGP